MSEKTNENNQNEEKLEGNNDKTVNEVKGSKKTKKEEPKSFARELVEWIVCIVIAFVLALIIKYYIFTPTLVLQPSMTPTILSEERVLINRLTRTFGWELKRGDIITFEAPVNYSLSNGEIVATYREIKGLGNLFLYNVLEAGKTSYIKRIIAVSGDKVEITGGKVYVNDEIISEDYLPEGTKTYLPKEGGMPKSFVVPEGHVFAMGDNREGSSDCRMFGCIPIEKVEGRVSIRIWPLNKLGSIDK